MRPAGYVAVLQQYNNPNGYNMELHLESSALVLYKISADGTSQNKIIEMI